jgi:protein suppressor of PHYA-105 1
MPEVNGIQLLQYVKQEENLRSVPVIMMSSIDKGDTVFECVSSGAEEYLVKPVTRKEVQHMWQHVLRKRSALATVPQAIPGDAEVITIDGPSTTAEDNNNTGDLHDISRASHGPVTAPLNNLQKTPAAAAAALEGAKQFLLLMRQARQAEAAKIQRQLAEIELDIEVIGGKKGVVEVAPSVKRQRTSISGISNATTNTTITTNTTTTNWTAISSRLDSLEPLYFDRRRSSNGNPVSALDSLARDLNVLSKSSSLEVCASLRAGDIASPQEMVCCADFAADDRHFATVSVSRSVKVFDFEAVLSSPSSLHVPVWQASTRSKLSSVSWNAYVRPHLLTSDYDGLIQLWDASAGPASSSETAQYEEHSRRVWSVDFSRADPMRFVSGSDDATVRLWNVNQNSSATVMRAPANICSVQFSPTNGNLIAAGCANHRVYMYDLRKANTPAAVISGSNRAVSYVRFMGPHSLVAASTDNAIRVWDVEEALTAGCGGSSASGVALPPRCVFTGHRNERNFVGLSATDDGYIATGSEDNSIHTYYKTLPFSVASHRLGDGLTQPKKRTTHEKSTSGGQQPSSSGGTIATKKGGSSGSSHRTFVSSVCWARGGRHCLAANSQGVLSVLQIQ